jgi:two-component system, CAI-1 autoinducer sensor kinase/phosphatase CqsS
MIKNIISFFRYNLEDASQVNLHNLLPAVIFGSLAHILLYLYHLHYLELKECLILRLITISFFLILIPYYLYFKNRKSSKLKRFLPLLWHIALIMALPLVITYNLLLNDFHHIWMWWMIFMPICLSIFVPNWLIYYLDLILGILAAYLIYYMSNDYIFILNNNIQYADEYSVVFLFSAIAGSLFSYGNRNAWLYNPKNQNRDLTLMAGSIAHELRIPFSAIKSNIDYVSDKEDVEMFKYNSNKIISLADNLIDVALLQLSGKEIDKKEFNYHSAQNIVADALSIYSYENELDKEKVVIEIDEEYEININELANIDHRILCNFKSDNNFAILVLDAPFKYIIFNLIKNALFYTKKRKDSEITIYFEHNKEIAKDLIKKFNLNRSVKKYNIINILDNGPGIKPEIINKIFDSYFICNQKEDIGLGLNFCKRTMKDFGGDIICESRLGKWTKFSLLLPILEDDENKKAVKKITDKVIKKSKDLNNKKYILDIEKSLKTKIGKNILLVDDVRLNIEILAKELKDRCSSFNITIMTNPKKAINLIKNMRGHDHQFDLILTDIEMPIMDGVELVREVRENLNISKDEIPILAYSAKEGSDIIEKALKSGCNAYYTKPKELRFIARNIAKWVLSDYIPNKNIYHEDIIVNDKILENLNVIIADDQAVSLTLMIKKLFDAGANITKCIDGSEIIDLVKKDPTKYNLIITDIHMENIDGDEAAYEVRKIQSEYNIKHNTHHKVPIVILSGDIKKESVMRILNNGVDDYISKSKDPKLLIKLCKFWVDYRYDQRKELAIDLDKDSDDILRKNFTSIFPSKKEAIEIINIFDLESEKALLDIKDNKDNIKSLQKYIHKLKGLTGSIGAIAAYNYLVKLNDMTIEGNYPEDNDFDKIIAEKIEISLKEMNKIIEKTFS